VLRERKTAVETFEKMENATLYRFHVCFTRWDFDGMKPFSCFMDNTMDVS
jgi:hypothetical protein